VAWPPRVPVQVCGVGGVGALAGGLTACCLWVRVVPRSGSVGLVWGGQHLFMALRCGNDMTKLLWRVADSKAALRGGVVVVDLSCQGTCGQSVHSCICFV
jgi:hypothetical protein